MKLNTVAKALLSAWVQMRIFMRRSEIDFGGSMMFFINSNSNLSYPSPITYNNTVVVKVICTIQRVCNYKYNYL